MKKIESLKKLLQSNTSPPSHCFPPWPDKGGFGTFILFYSYFCPPHPFTFFIMEMKRTRPSLFLTARVWPEYYNYTILTTKGAKTSRKLVFATNELSMLYKVALWTFIFCITATRNIQNDFEGIVNVGVVILFKGWRPPICVFFLHWALEAIIDQNKCVSLQTTA